MELNIERVRVEVSSDQIHGMRGAGSERIQTCWGVCGNIPTVVFVGSVGGKIFLGLDQI